MDSETNPLMDIVLRTLESFNRPERNMIQRDFERKTYQSFMEESRDDNLRDVGSSENEQDSSNSTRQDL